MQTTARISAAVLVALVGGLDLVAPARAAAPPVVLGGTCTMQDLLTVANTDSFRAAGGGVYLHQNGWMQTLTSTAQRQTVWNLFKPNGQANVEFGYASPPKSWTDTYTANYVNNGVNVETISVNDLSDAPVASAEAYIDAFKKLGVANITIISSPNKNATDAAQFPFADASWNNLRTLATYGGGWTSDAPPSYFFARDQPYRDWIVAETQWVNAHGLKSINIISPHTSGANLFADSVKYVRYFETANAIPKQWVVENYASIGPPPAGYVNQIGSEDVTSNLAYTANWLIGHVQGRPRTLDLYAATAAGAKTGQNTFGTAPAAQSVALPTAAGSATYTLTLSNLSTDATTGFYAPLLSATETGDTAHWTLQFKLGTTDVTASVLGGGLTLSGTNLLEAGTAKSLTLTATRLTGATGRFTLDVLARADPDASVVADAMEFAATPEPASLALLAAAVPPLLMSRRRRRPSPANITA